MIFMINESTINLLLQIPLAGVIVYVVYIFLQYIQRMFDKMMTFMKEQAEINRDFLKTQREQENEALARLAEEQKITREELAKMTVVMDRLIAYFPARKRNRNV